MAQASLPGLEAPPTEKPKRVEFRLLEFFRNVRGSKLGPKGLDVMTFEELLELEDREDDQRSRDALPAAFVVIVFKRIMKALEQAGLDPEEGARDVIRAWFRCDWGAKYTPPWRFQSFGSEKVWPKLVAEVVEESRG